MSDRQGVEIDYCRACRGVWLDRDELDKIIDRSLNGAPATPRVSERRSEKPQRDDREYRRNDEDDRHKKKKSRGFLGEIFDVFD